MANASSGDMRELFLNGSLAIEFWPALEQPTLQKSKINWDFVDGTAPAGKTPIGTYGGWNLVMYANSPNKEAAWKFIQFLTREDVNGKVVDLIPANVKAADAFLKANRKGPDRIMAQLNNAAPRPLSPRYLEVSDIEVTLAQDVFARHGPEGRGREGLRRDRRAEVERDARQAGTRPPRLRSRRERHEALPPRQA